MKWQDISTAPKDGTRILVFSSSGIFTVEWTNQNIEYWHVDDNKNGPYPLRGSNPTHWMPLPKPPVKEN